MSIQDYYMYGFNFILSTYGGYKLEDLLQMPVTRYYALIKLISHVNQNQEDYYKKNKNKRK